MADAEFPQCRIVTERLLKPETVEKILNKLAVIPGIRRIVINGPSIPQKVPYGPARGLDNPHSGKATIRVGVTDVDLRVQVGTFLLELETRDIVSQVEEACKEVFTNFSYSVKEGKFMRSTPTQVDYAKYGPNANEIMLGLVDPKNKTGPTLIQGHK
ncbi:Methyl-coenzyme M reductase, protein D [Methanospirillum hungatei JF-1]|jgi:methyl-coenzyme M reductase subunit D|uniref:Methyl-coenzyme M reductase, protein D n=1 Tax=Methanospirillum hungatei JF-1 (strain ATCC 27890 / DSM 864 / NBRC 100397 / JF-1) TaxID=323259 RepID=Q2FSN3_METHJ|nr:methyl-coenzyme M reductase operon protein D [Methanospirillum hungatei]ABD41851.1 Methyl-coenzyme M reductase, protein D [Methanospirillum hungatei JF-1]MCA1917082.1 methyl-coenzyme M reductase operon protein D [Methanospirillum hungatei]HOW05664.1 methyl-coenzyme M reductase operon protein D [Methanospirillum hungatei]